MPIKKTLIVLGLVCVVAPALAASAALMARPGGYAPGELPDGSLAALIASLQNFIDQRNDKQEFVDDGHASGVVRLPFRKNMQGMIDLTGVYFAFDAEAVGAAFDDGEPPHGMVGVTGGPVGAQGGGTSEQGGAGDNGSMVSSGGTDRAAGMGGGIGGVGSGGSARGGGEAVGLTELAMNVDLNDGVAEGTDGETLLAMPLPASVWMLMASMIGLAFIRYRRRHSV